MTWSERSWMVQAALVAAFGVIAITGYAADEPALLIALPAAALPLMPPALVTVVTSGVAVALVALLSVDVSLTAVATRLTGVSLVAIITVCGCGYRRRAESAHAELSAVIERVVLRPVPRRIGAIRTEVSYLPAGRAWAGGDLYDAVATPYGVRLIIGDVMGKGHDAMERAADVLGAFRELAHHETTLEGVAIRLDSFLSSRDECEQFVTALFVEIPVPSGPGERVLAELVSCGHPPPLMLADDCATFADVLVPAPPLGLMGLTHRWCVSSFIDLAPGSALLLYTDGVTEARDRSGTFYPLADRVALLMASGHGRLVDKLTRDVGKHADGRLHDDAALLLAHFEPSVVPARPAVEGRSR
jgi:hypothetical protein